MDQTGMWKLFFATGLPEAYLAVRSQEEGGLSASPPPQRPLCGTGAGAVPGNVTGDGIS